MTTVHGMNTHITEYKIKGLKALPKTIYIH